MNWIKNKNIICVLLFLILCGRLFSQSTVCTGAISVTVNNVCIQTNIISGSSTIEAPNPPSCVAVTSQTRDLWFKFQATSSTATISLQSMTGSSTKEIVFVVYNAPCAAGLVTNTTELACVNNVISTAAQTESVVVTTLVVGNIYFIRAFMFNGGSGNVQVKLCIESPQANDEPTSATALTAPSTTCNDIQGNLKNATQTTCGGLAAPLCGNYGASSVDVWYQVNVPASGNLFLQASCSELIGIATYTGTPCVSLTQIGCSEGNPEGASTYNPVLNVPGLAIGTPVYVRVWNQNGEPISPFSICATTLGPCGNALNVNDNCETPYAIFTSGATNTMVAVGYTGTPMYTQDLPGDVNLNNTCATSNGIAYNSWYTFVATTPSVSIPVTTSNCEVDVELFSVSTNTYGCCKNFAPVSGLQLPDPDPDLDGIPCTAGYTWSVAANSTATITATGLTNGQTYYMMVNYPNAMGAACSFSVKGWAYTGVLPIDLISFTAVSNGKNNVINWLVGDESTVSYYVLESSEDAVSFSPLGTIIAKGNKVTNTSYQFVDEHTFKSVTYYRIKQVYKDGSEKYTNTISVFLDDKYDNIYNIYPNPTNSDLNFEYYLKSAGNISVMLADYAGKTAFNADYNLTEGQNKLVLPMKELSNGVYILKVVSVKSGKTTYHKIIKN